MRLGNLLFCILFACLLRCMANFGARAFTQMFLSYGCIVWYDKKTEGGGLSMETETLAHPRMMVLSASA